MIDGYGCVPELPSRFGVEYLMADEPRELTPLISYHEQDQGNRFRDFGPRPIPSSAEEVTEAEEAMTPAPKDESVQESASSSAPLGDARSEMPVLPPITVQAQDVDKENGKDSESSADEPMTQNLTPPSRETSSRDSSSTPPKTGSPVPPAPVAPPT